MMVFVRWARRIGALLSAAVLGALLPAVAWAQTSSIAVAGDLAKPKIKAPKGILAFGGLTALCCLVVVVVIVLIIAMIVRRKKQ